MSVVLAFDIGIRNLAWCLATKTADKYTVIGWQNYDQETHVRLAGWLAGWGAGWLAEAQRGPERPRKAEHV